MKRNHILSVMVLVVGIPAAAVAGSSLFSMAATPCFATGAASYRFAKSAAEFIVRIDNQAAQPDLRLQLVGNPAEADFLLVDDGITLRNACGASPHTIRIDDAAHTPDLTVALSRDDAAPYRIYVQSADFSERDAAALFAVIWKSEKLSALAARR